MNKKIFSYFEIAAKLAEKKSALDKRSFLLGAIGIRNDGTMVSTINGSSESPNRHAHAEKKLTRQLDHGATVYVVRTRLSDGSFAMARPCQPCFKALISKKVKTIYYSISDVEYGIMRISYSNTYKVKEFTRIF